MKTIGNGLNDRNDQTSRPHKHFVHVHQKSDNETKTRFVWVEEIDFL